MVLSPNLRNVFWENEMEWLYLILCGAIGGILGGMGMGGGTFLIPLLTIFLNLSQTSAQAINLIAFLPMSIVTLIIHFHNRLVKVKTSLPIICTGVLSAVIGAFLATKIDSNNLSFYFGIFLILIGVFQFVSIWFVKKK